MYKVYNILLILSILLIGCSKKEAIVAKDSNIVKKKRVEINASQRASEEGGLLSGFGKQKNTTYDFSTSNPMWRAAISSFESIPLNTVDYSGGVIITDWYSNGSNENIKINVNFVSDELKASSIKVNSFKRICKTINECAVQKMSTNFDNQIKESIISKAIALNIKSQSKKN